MPKTTTRITVDIPTIYYKKLKMLAAYHGKSMRALFVELIERSLQDYQECFEDHIPNQITKKTIETIEAQKGLKKAHSVEELLKKLSP